MRGWVGERIKPFLLASSLPMRTGRPRVIRHRDGELEAQRLIRSNKHAAKGPETLRATFPHAAAAAAHTLQELVLPLRLEEDLLDLDRF